MLYSSVPSEHTCLSELLMRIDTSVRIVCQHNYFCIQHCHFVNRTQISDVIKILRFGMSDSITNLYSDNFKHSTGYFFHCISVVINCMLCHGYVKAWSVRSHLRGGLSVVYSVCTVCSVVCPCQLFCSVWMCCLEEIYKCVSFLSPSACIVDPKRKTGSQDEINGHGRLPASGRS